VKPLLLFCGLLLLVCFPFLHAQDTGPLNWDFDTLFDEPGPEIPSEETKTETTDTASTVMDLIQRRGFVFNASSEFAVGIAPGWYETPWSSEWSFEDRYTERIFKMHNSFSMNAQISNVFRVSSTIFFEIPNFRFALGDFFFDYSLYSKVFFRGGKYNLSWGISPNYNYTNLLARIPKDSPGGDSFILKADIPSGIGGFQVLALTRANLMSVSGAGNIALGDIGFGGKYNLALRRLDLDLGMFYQEEMPLRAFLSLKTTYRSTELYSEGLIAVDVHELSNISGAASLGFSRDFFDSKLTTNAEVFYNAEGNSFWYRPETSLRDSEISPFIEGLNGALNLRYRFNTKGDPHLFLQMRYAPLQNSAQLIPGFTLHPWPHVEVHFAIPMALGSKDGYYHLNTVRKGPEDLPLPFGIMLAITIKGGVQFAHYY
jgi:hypothetical protein